MLHSIDSNDVYFMLLHHQYISELKPNAFTMFPNLISLSITESSVKKIEFGAFKNLKKLSTLTLWGNKIDFIGSGAFDDLVSIEQIDLTGSPIDKYVMKVHPT